MTVVLDGGMAGGPSCAARPGRVGQRPQILTVERGPHLRDANRNRTTKVRSGGSIDDCRCASATPVMGGPRGSPRTRRPNAVIPGNSDPAGDAPIPEPTSPRSHHMPHDQIIVVPPTQRGSDRVVAIGPVPADEKNRRRGGADNGDRMNADTARCPARWVPTGGPGGRHRMRCVAVSAMVAALAIALAGLSLIHISE